MKNFKIIVVLTVVAFSLGNCSNHKTDDLVMDPIELDNGNRWTVHDNMIVHIEKMADDIQLTASMGDKDYDNLTSELLASIDALTSDCTMKGKAHDELHKWLHPFMSTVKKYEHDMTEKQKAEWLVKLQGSMNEFDTYFN